jgi:HPt (histidine-containing phosphotransfer) domain-containing protein
MPDREIIDSKALERLIEWGGPRLQQQMMKLFVEHAPERMSQIRNGLAASDAHVVELGSHSLKSSAGNVGALSVQALAEQVENAAAEEDLATVEGLLPELESAFDEARAALEKMKGGTEE